MGKKKQKKPAEMRPALTGPVQRSEGESENKAPEANPIDAELRVDRGHKEDATIAADEIEAFAKKKKQKKPAEMRPALMGPVQRSEGESENKAPEANPVDAKLRGDRGDKKDATIAVEEIQAFVKKKKPQKPADMRINNTKKEERINIEKGKDGARSNNAQKKRQGKADKTHELDGELPCSPFQGVMVETVLEDTVEPQVTQVDSLPADRQGAPSNQRQNKRGNKNDITTATEEKQAFDQKRQKKVAAPKQSLQKSKKNNEDRRIEQNDKVERGETVQKSKKKNGDRRIEQNDAVERGEALQKSKKNNE